MSEPVTEVYGDTTVAHRGGVAWFDAPVPPRWHKCQAQTNGWIMVTQIWRCACGALCYPSPTGHHVWLDRNSRKRRP